MANSTLVYLTGLLIITLEVCGTFALSCYNQYKYLDYEICYGSDNHCCGYFSHYKYCCYSLEGGTIAGIVVGCLIGVGVLITLCIVCCCIAMNKNRGSVGRVVHPAGGTGLTVVNASSQQAMYGGPGQYGPSYPQYGGGYSNPSAPPGYNPAYSSEPGPNPAYPSTQPVNPPPYA
uniref:Cysteine and tyrosine-rich protein 1 n=1 Tax=Pinctada fucata TaxID=50426 RepID=A0A194APW0_PINFU